MLEDDVRGYLRTAVAIGRDTRAAMIRGVVEHLEHEAEPADIERLAGPVLAAELAAHLEAQRTWPERTDNDRLDDAFRALEEERIVARQDFSCCRNCGSGEINEVARAYPRPAGYVFYHAQDTERAAEGGGLHLAYGPGQFGELVGTKIVETVRAAGLRVDWPGSLDKRIHVRLKWARRRYDGEAAAFEVSSGEIPEPRPMSLGELRDVLRRLPAKPGTWLGARAPNGVVVQVRQDDDGLWLETPEPSQGRSPGRHATLTEAARTFATLAAEGRADLGEAGARPW
jgi:uncharacterized protein DUF6891